MTYEQYIKMNELKPLTLEDIYQLKGTERTIALSRWQKHNLERWKQARKEIKYFENKKRIAKRIHKGLCPYCGMEKERNDRYACSKCAKSKYNSQKRKRQREKSQSKKKNGKE